MPNRTEAARRKPSQSPLGDYGHCAFSRLHRRSLIVLASRFRASRLTRRDASAIAPQGGGDWRARSSRCGSSGGNHWNQECRGVLGVVQDRVCGRHKLAARRLIRAGVQVAIKAREIAAGNFRRMMWPLRKTLLVAHKSTEILYTWSGFNSSGFSCESR